MQIQFPDRGAEREDIISITGYEKDTEAAKEDILRIVHELVREKIVQGVGMKIFLLLETKLATYFKI